ncbi:unnamed protein product [Dovyalis caffra]|uniref:Uncharacterized protein n=1 Tax=Dovyalis caffra TaxID=77055 RepID=A0AAV1REL7_9ROSI|nr:unnamed protein product [Dovyalis caffra]
MTTLAVASSMITTRLIDLLDRLNVERNHQMLANTNQEKFNNNDTRSPNDEGPIGEPSCKSYPKVIGEGVFPIFKTELDVR